MFERERGMHRGALRSLRGQNKIRCVEQSSREESVMS